MTAFVLDASVAVKWVIPSANEALSAQSLRLLRRYVAGEIDFVVPDIFWAEIGNVLWKGARQQRWSRTLAEGAASGMKDRNFLTISTQILLPAALKIALLYDRSVYDAMYVAAAIQFKIEMITADERLANALAASLPVKWLGAFAI
ncbi:MAG: type II toxin-antitoxin system VapC family toxin [Candidatus Sulfotelmatobacter sp.]